MDAPAPWSPVAALKRVAELTISMATVAGIMNGAVWFVVSPRVTPALEALAQIPDLTRRIAELEAGVPPTPFVEFDPLVRVRPTETTAGSAIKITYLQRRNLSCDATVHVRFYSLETDSFDTRFSYDFPAIKAPVSGAFAPFSITLHVPEALPAGEWAYWPEIEPELGCPDDQSRQPPQAVFTVLIPEDAE